MMRNVVIGASLFALGVIVAGSLSLPELRAPDLLLLKGAAPSRPSATGKSFGSMTLGSGQEEPRRCT